VEIVTLAERPDLRPALDAPELDPGPAFISHGATAARWWRKFESAFSDFEIALLDGERVAAKGRAIPLQWPQGAPLPDEGWDFALERGMNDHQAGREPTIASALWIVVAADRQGEGLSARMIAGLRDVAARHGLRELVAPVRPPHKARYPFIPMAEYVEWADAEGAPFDPWLRTHWRQGGAVVGICERSMTITGTVADWEEWSGLAMPASGSYVVDEALVPVEVDREADTATYVEPNVWVRHEVGASPS